MGRALRQYAFYLQAMLRRWKWRNRCMHYNCDQPAMYRRQVGKYWVGRCFRHMQEQLVWDEQFFAISPAKAPSKEIAA
jgi:hypothetical protein